MEQSGHIQDLRRALRTNTLVPFIGAGVSMPAGAPSWKAYLERIRDSLPKGDPLRSLRIDVSDSYLDVAEVLVHQLRLLGKDPPGVAIEGASSLHRELAAWRAPLYITTNYDRGMEQALGPSVDVMPSDQLHRLKLAFDDDARIQLVKLMSTASQQAANGGALSVLQYANALYRDVGAFELLVTLLRTRTLLFVGCGLRDPFVISALQRVKAQQVGSLQHYAIMPSTVGDAQRQSLQNLGVEIIKVRGGSDLTSDVRFALHQISGGPYDPLRALLVFEPGTVEKTRCVLEALNTLRMTDPLKSPVRTLVVTTNPTIVEQLAPSGAVFRVLHVANLEPDVVRRAVSQSLNGEEELFLAAPYEFAIEAAASFAHRWHADVGRYPASALILPEAKLSRDKELFAKAMAAFPDHRIPYAKVTWADDDRLVDQLLQQINRFSAEAGCSEVILKPVDAAASIGVRPLDTGATDAEQRAVVGELLDILRRMPINDETNLCRTGELLLQERLRGEEFSVEGLFVDGKVETLGIHWKVDIDSDKSRFFERLFVTLDPLASEYVLLERQNGEIVKRVYPDRKMVALHAEYRLEGQKARPLEIALRPGGGMVPHSIAAHRGRSVYEFWISSMMGARVEALEARPAVATGLIFAGRPATPSSVQRAGVLGVLEVQLADGSWTTVPDGNARLLCEMLKHRLRTIDRETAYATYLEPLLRPRTSSLREQCLSTFRRDGRPGLAVELETPRLWMHPGDWIEEEEACYVGGLLARAVPSLGGPAAMAETLAALALCLNVLRCAVHEARDVLEVRLGMQQVREKVIVWAGLNPGTFHDDEDSVTFSRGLELAVGRYGGRTAGVVDLGCGSARPVIQLLQQNSIAYVGVDIQEANIAAAKKNITTFLRAAERRRTRVIVQDVTHETLGEEVRAELERMEARKLPVVVAANLPYLPHPSDVSLPIEVDGGDDGLRYSPRRVLAIAKQLKAERCVINFSSVCDLKGLAREVRSLEWTAEAAVATCAPLGAHTSVLQPWLQTNGFSTVYGSPSAPRQMIYSLVLVPSLECFDVAFMIERLERALAADRRPVGVYVEATGSQAED